MKRALIVCAAPLAVAVLLLVADLAYGQSTTVVIPEPTTPTPSAAKAVSAAKVSGPLRDVLQRRRLGVTFVNVARIVREMDAAGELDRDQPDGIALQVLARLQAENPEEFAKVMADRDWASFFDALLAFLEKMIPIFMQFFSMSPSPAA
jgi:hypothetical protein